VSESPSDIAALITSKTPSQSYKRDNSDIKQDDASFFTIILKDGRLFNYYLTVIDRNTGLSHWNRKHQNQTRYIEPEDSPNIKRNGTKLINTYSQPEIRVD
jgi:hypothetical protein